MSCLAGRARIGRNARVVCGLLGGLAFSLWPCASLHAGGLSDVQTVFIILMENNSWSGIEGSPNAPYINHTLLPMASYCENYQNVPGLHPSLPNYLWLEAGTNYGITDDSDPSVHHQNDTNHLVTQLENAGVSWKTYQEDISGAYVPLTSTNGYAPKHNPVVYFDDVTGTNNVNWPYGIAHIRPFTELAKDLTNNTVARYNFITPDLCDDMHDNCSPLQNRNLQGDNWLASQVPLILASRAYSNNGALFITWDESSGSDTRVGMIVLSPLARGGGYTNSMYYTHGSTLRTFQEIFQVGPFLRGAASATDLSDLFQTGNAIPSKLQISRVVNVGNGVFQLVATGVVTNTPLILQSSSNLLTWASMTTNLSPPATYSTYVTNSTGSNSPVFYRFAQ